MLLLVLGLVLWTVAHGMKIHAPAQRRRLVEKYGEGWVKGGAALALVLAVALMTLGYQMAAYDELWGKPGWTVHLNNFLMVAAVAVFIAGPIPSDLRRWVRHPQLTGVKIWALAHLLSNGDLASLVLFGGLTLWAAAAMVGLNRRDGKGPMPGPGTLVGNLGHIAVTIAIFAGLTWVHNYLGVWPFPG